ncbi:hypothetical protein L218DRAFT_999133 [Marasmius fiardii PR-910]|nr:hypothetical protein L218DRAFT_999133 [Marasmius fiardii PR-910]
MAIVHASELNRIATDFEFWNSEEGDTNQKTTRPRKSNRHYFVKDANMRDYVPSDIEISQLRDALKEGEQEVEQYEEDIGVLRQTLDRLENAKNIVEATNRKRCAALSVQRRIPVEIWKTIFSALCLSLHEYSFNIDYDSPYSPLLQVPAILLTQVCSHWNVIAKGIPSLWASIKANIDDIPYNVTIPLEVYLSRSQGHPLDLRIEGGEDGSLSPAGLNVWLSISRHLCRSRTLTMSIRKSYVLIPSHNLTFPSLESFHEESELPDEHFWPWFWQAIQEAPRLTTLSTKFPSPRIIPFSQLTEWEVQTCDWSDEDLEDLLNVLPSCTRLNSFTMAKLMGTIGRAPAVRDINLPSLRHLAIRGYSSHRCSWLSAILSSLLAPSLETCEIQFSRWPLPHGLFTTVRCSSLKTLRLTLLPGMNRVLTRDSLLDLLQAASGLTQLELSMGGKALTPQGYLDGMVSTLLLKLKNDPHGFLPKIDILHLDLPCITLNMQLVEKVLEVVRARQFISQPITDFRLVRHWVRCREQVILEEFVVEFDVFRKIKELEESGIRVFVGESVTG